MSWIRRHELVVVFSVMVCVLAASIWLVGRNARLHTNRVNDRVTDLCEAFAAIKRVELAPTARELRTERRSDVQTAVVKILGRVNCQDGATNP